MYREMLKKVIKKLFKLVKPIIVRALGTITHVETADYVIALTFDDGPDPVYTPQLLEILDKYNARATFFMVGRNAEKYPDLVRRIAQKGHAIGNHSWDHPSFPLIKGMEQRAQIRSCQNAIAPFGERLFRPPYGNQSIMSCLDALVLGYKIITWNQIAVDWVDESGEVMAKRLIEKINKGSIVLFHDSLYHMLKKEYTDRTATLIAVEELLAKLSDRYRFVTVSDLLQHGRPQRTLWFQKPVLNLLNDLKGNYEEPRRYSLK